MNITNDQIKAVFETLPISFYLGQNIDVELVYDHGDAYYDFNLHKIKVGTDIIKNAVMTLQDETKLEGCVRAVLYHEISHVILTSSNLLWACKTARLPIDGVSRQDIMNIFEDERIETLLAHYYFDVDFKKNVFAINGCTPATIPPATSDINKFYSVVRFRSDPRFAARIDGIIAKYANYTSNFPVSHHDFEGYVVEVFDLYHDIVGNNPAGKSDTKDESAANPGAQTNAPAGSSTAQTDDSTGDNQSPSLPSNWDELSDAERQQVIDANFAGKDGGARGHMNQVCNTMTGDTYMTELTQKLDRIFTLALNRRRNHSTSRHGYSGNVDPRRFERTDHDWKVFERRGNESGKRFNKIQLNLWLDNSGSFTANCEFVNNFIACLEQIEAENPNFVLEIVTQDGHTEYLDRSKPRRIDCCGCSVFKYDEARPIWNKINAPRDREIYNILLFDGSMFSKTVRQAFAMVDVPNMTMIVERDNLRYLPAHPRARVIIENEHYTARLCENILNVLERTLCR